MSDTIRIKTNRMQRLLVNWDQLTPAEQSEFDYIAERDRDGRHFVRYLGTTYDLGDFMRCPTLEQCNPQMRDAGFYKWHGYAGDSYFSGVLMKYCPDWGRVVMATYFC